MANGNRSQKPKQNQKCESHSSPFPFRGGDGCKVSEGTPAVAFVRHQGPNQGPNTATYVRLWEGRQGDNLRVLWMGIYEWKFDFFVNGRATFVRMRGWGIYEWNFDFFYEWKSDVCGINMRVRGKRDLWMKVWFFCKWKRDVCGVNMRMRGRGIYEWME